MGSNYALTLGNFDGVHLGHKKLLDTLKEICSKNNLKPLVVTLRPHPLEVLTGRKGFLIESYDKKISELKKGALNEVYEIPFTRDLSNLSPTDFLEQIIYPKYKIDYFVLGHDFSFGIKRSGTLDFMRDYCALNHKGIAVAEPFSIDGKIVSSTSVREALNIGDVAEAAKFMGRPYSMEGIVIKGDGRGKELGFPTANINYSFLQLIPMDGVYASKTIIDGKTYLSMTSIGNNPTFDGKRERRIETHLLDFNQDLYGKSIEVLFCERVRGTFKFSSVEKLIDQINKDRTLIENILR